MKAVVVLAFPGAPPLDFPKSELAEFFGLQARLGQTYGQEYPAIHRRHEELETKIRGWPRNAANDPFFANAQELAVELQRASGCKIIIGFNEFCRPSLDEALDQAAGQGAENILIVAPTITRGGEYAERSIPAAVERARKRNGGETFVYIWPFPVSEIAEFLTAQIQGIS